MSKVTGLMERLNRGEKVICAEGYLFNFEKRCYLTAGPFVPEVVGKEPELVRQLHREFVRAGSDVVQAFTYYLNRGKTNLIDCNDVDHVQMNKLALKIAREVADETGTLMCGDISNTCFFKPGDPESIKQLKASHKEQIEWAVEAGADFIVGETMFIYEEAAIALESMKKYGNNLPIVLTVSGHHIPRKDGKVYMADGVELTDACLRLEAAGADVVGVNCCAGPEVTLNLVEQILKAGVKIPVAALPVTYRTTQDHPSFLNLTDPKTGKHSFPLDLDCHSVTRSDIHDFGRRCVELGIQYVGLCCGNTSHYTRALAESLGRKPPASQYSPQVDLHFLFGKSEKVHSHFAKEIKEKMTSPELAMTKY